MVDAGKFDGALGIISAISGLKVLRVSDKLKRLKRPIEVSICQMFLEGRRNVWKLNC